MVSLENVDAQGLRSARRQFRSWLRRLNGLRLGRLAGHFSPSRALYPLLAEGFRPREKNSLVAHLDWCRRALSTVSARPIGRLARVAKLFAGPRWIIGMSRLSTILPEGAKLGLPGLVSWDIFGPECRPALSKPSQTSLSGAECVRNYAPAARIGGVLLGSVLRTFCPVGKALSEAGLGVHNSYPGSSGVRFVHGHTFNATP